MMFFEIWLQGFGLVMIPLTLLWLWSVKLKNASIIDPFWGTGFVILAFYFLYETGLNPRSILLTALVSIWGLRLSIFLLIRNMGHGEDYRYQNFRKDYGPERYWWFSFFQVFLLQGILMCLVAFPLLGTMIVQPSGPLGMWDILVVILWAIGLAFEAGGDYQLNKFKKESSNKGKVLDTGFWRYTRHPNYFGDAVIWWSYGLFAIISGSYWTIIGAVIMNFLIVKVSGVSMLERTLKTSKPQYADYIARTNSFFPWIPKKATHVGLDTK